MRLALSLDLQNQGAASDVQLRAPLLARFLCDWPWQNSHDHSIGRQSAEDGSSETISRYMLSELLHVLTGCESH